MWDYNEDDEKYDIYGDRHGILAEGNLDDDSDLEDLLEMEKIEIEKKKRKEQRMRRGSPTATFSSKAIGISLKSIQRRWVFVTTWKVRCARTTKKPYFGKLPPKGLKCVPGSTQGPTQ